MRDNLISGMKSILNQEYFEDGVEADLHSEGVKKLSDAFMAGVDTVRDQISDLLKEEENCRIGVRTT